jgi:hypothetical protein
VCCLSKINKWCKVKKSRLFIWKYRKRKLRKKKYNFVLMNKERRRKRKSIISFIVRYKRPNQQLIDGKKQKQVNKYKQTTDDKKTCMLNMELIVQRHLSFIYSFCRWLTVDSWHIERSIIYHVGIIVVKTMLEIASDHFRNNESENFIETDIIEEFCGSWFCSHHECQLC